MATLRSHSIDHPTLGNITGRLFENQLGLQARVVQFRSIPYATAPARFRPSVLLDSVPETFDERPHGDFTNYGYACPATPQGSDFCGGRLEGEEDCRYDEFACLNLTISAPVKFLDAKTRGEDIRLPVMVYVHGGGFTVGAGHVSALHDTTRPVALSVKDEMPVIIVSIGYRLNWFGFMACHDLVEEASLSPSAGSPFNLGLQDQRNAFLWVHKNISGFGGDAANITAFGESAGSASLALHLCCDEPLFKRVVLQSGQVGTLPSGPLEEQDRTYRRLLAYLNIEGDCATTRLELLRKISATELVVAIAHVTDSYFSPCTEDPDPHGFFGGTQPTYWTSPEFSRKCNWIDELIIGDCQLEGEVLSSLSRMVDQKLFVAKVKEAFGIAAAQRVLEVYDISTEGNMDGNMFWYNLMALLGDIMFSEPSERLANALAHDPSKKVYRYAMCLSNPFVGTGLVWHTGQHCIEIMYLFLTLADRYPRWRDNFLLKQAFETSRRWLRFANGLAPWEDYEGNNIAVCDDLRGWETRTLKEDEEVSQTDPWGPRRYAARRIIREAFEEVAASGNGEYNHLSADERTEHARRIILNFKSYIAR